MTNPFVLPAVVSTVRSEQSMHYSAQCVFSHFDNQVDVIGHQAVSVEEEGQPGLLPDEQEEYPVVVVVGTEGKLSIVAACEDVVEAAFDFNPQFSSHVWISFSDSTMVPGLRFAILPSFLVLQ